MRPYALLYLYRARLRAHAAQELLAGLGVATAVALIFAVTLSNSSIAGSASEAVHTVIGPASLQLRSRGSEGFDEELLTRVEQLAGVKQAAPLLEQDSTIIGPTGQSTTVDLVGAEVSLAILDGLAHTLPIATLTHHGLGLSEGTAHQLDITASSVKAGIPENVRLKLRGTTSSLQVSAVLGSEAVGALSKAVIAVMPLARLQQLSGLGGRLSRILVQTEPGREATVRSELRTLAAGRITVAPADEDVALLRQALGPSRLSTDLFVAIAGLLGFLFAFNAMLLTVPERRQAIADLRVGGTKRSAIVQMVLFQALCLGLLAAVVGLLVGYGLSLWVLHLSTSYLSRAFLLGGKTIVGVRPVLFALIGGVLATCLASTVLLFDLRGRRALDAVYFEHGVPGNALSRRAQVRLAVAAMSLLVFATAIFVLAPSATVVASGALALATVLAVPVVLAGVLGAARWLTDHDEKLTILPLALTSLRATTLRSLALAATGAVALFGSVALGGARDDLLRGIDGFTHGYAADANLWVTSPNDNQATVDFLANNDVEGIAHTPGIASVGIFQGSFLEFGNRLVWIIARPPDATREMLSGQIIGGDSRTASLRLREGGWITVSQQLAAEHHVGVGDTLILPTPTGNLSLRVAATTTNFGWPPGAILMSTADYASGWDTSAATALSIRVRPGVNVKAARGAIERQLGLRGGLEVLTTHEREAKIEATASEGLGQLQQIATLLVIAAILALAAALGSSIWQRRLSLSGLRLEGTPPRRLRQILGVESALLLAAGCVTGVIAGIYGQVVIDGYLKQATGFPVGTFAASWRPLEIFGLVVGAVLVIVAVPAWFASQVSPGLSLEDE